MHPLDHTSRICTWRLTQTTDKRPTSYDRSAAPCKNGMEHCWKKIKTQKDRYRCEYCNEEKTIKDIWRGE